MITVEPCLRVRDPPSCCGQVWGCHMMLRHAFQSTRSLTHCAIGIAALLVMCVTGHTHILHTLFTGHTCFNDVVIAFLFLSSKATIIVFIQCCGFAHMCKSPKQSSRRNKYNITVTVTVTEPSIPSSCRRGHHHHHHQGGQRGPTITIHHGRKGMAVPPPTTTAASAAAATTSPPFISTANINVPTTRWR